MPEWETLLWIFFAVVMTGVIVASIGAVGYMRRENRLYAAEHKRWTALAQSGRPIEGTVRNFRLHPGNMTRGGSHGQTVCAVVLDIDYTDGSGAPRTAAVRTFIEDALVPSFQAPGKRVHLRVDPQDPALVAIDRERTPLEIPRAP